MADLQNRTNEGEADTKKLLASVGREGLNVWDLKKGGPRKTLRKDGSDRLLTPAPDGKRLICVAGKGNVEIIRIPSGRLDRAFEVGAVGMEGEVQARLLQELMGSHDLFPY